MNAQNIPCSGQWTLILQVPVFVLRNDLAWHCSKTVAKRTNVQQKSVQCRLLLIYNTNKN